MAQPNPPKSELLGVSGANDEAVTRNVPAPLKRPAAQTSFRKTPAPDMKAANDALDDIRDQVSDKADDPIDTLDASKQSLASIDNKMSQQISDNLASSIIQRRSEGTIISETQNISAKLSLLLGKLTEMHVDAQVEAAQKDNVKSAPDKIAPDKSAPDKSAHLKSAPYKLTPVKLASDKSASDKSASDKSAHLPSVSLLSNHSLCCSRIVSSSFFVIFFIACLF